MVIIIYITTDTAIFRIFNLHSSPAMLKGAVLPPPPRNPQPLSSPSTLAFIPKKLIFFSICVKTLPQFQILSFTPSPFPTSFPWCGVEKNLTSFLPFFGSFRGKEKWPPQYNPTQYNPSQYNPSHMLLMFVPIPPHPSFLFSLNQHNSKILETNNRKGFNFSFKG